MSTSPYERVGSVSPDKLETKSVFLPKDVFQNTGALCPSAEPELWFFNTDPSQGLEQYEKLELIGRGSNGTVYKVRHAKESKLYALKSIPLAKKNKMNYYG